jgi:hypothetical protein
MQRAEFCGVRTDDQTVDMVLRLAKMQTEFQALVKLCGLKAESKNNLGGIGENSFNNGEIVGLFKGCKLMEIFLLDIYRESCKNATIDK